MLQQHRRLPRRPPRQLPKFVPLKFDKLPLLIKGIVVRQWDVLDCVNFSLGCERIRRLLNCFKIQSNILSYTFDNNKMRISIEEENCFINIMTTKMLTRVRQGPCMRLNGEETEMEIQKALVQLGNSCKISIKVPDLSDDTVFSALEKMTIHLCQFLKPAKVNVHYNRLFGLHQLFVWKYIKEYNEVKIGKDDTNPVFPNNELFIAFENVKAKHFYFSNKNSHENIPLFMQRWLDGGASFKMNQLSVDANWTEPKFLNICETLKAKESEFSNEEIISCVPFHLNNYLPNLTRRDIKRESDGLTATLVYSRDSITVLFWNAENLKACGRN